MQIGIIGSGNVAGVLAKSLSAGGHTITYICSRNKTTGLKLARHFNAGYFSSPEMIPDQSELNIIATDDGSIIDVANRLPVFKHAVVHTSGATHSNVLKKFSSHGVLYPVNSINSKQKKITKGTCFCIEGNSPRLTSSLRKIVKSIDGIPVSMNSKDRLTVHVAAVFANNFVNSLYQASNDILEKNNLSFKIIVPLLETTLNNALSNKPLNVQTGPAVRNDRQTIKKHLSFLNNSPELKKIYNELTKLIVKQQQ
jgi:predicted short-subunit dehydrogenase-like oxidoreductase (DUF2520 family)